MTLHVQESCPAFKVRVNLRSATHFYEECQTVASWPDAVGTGVDLLRRVGEAVVGVWAKGAADDRLEGVQQQAQQHGRFAKRRVRGGIVGNLVVVSRRTRELRNPCSPC